jgi:hypothetical protein
MVKAATLDGGRTDVTTSETIKQRRQLNAPPAVPAIAHAVRFPLRYRDVIRDVS